MKLNASRKKPRVHRAKPLYFLFKARRVVVFVHRENAICMNCQDPRSSLAQATPAPVRRIIAAQGTRRGRKGLLVLYASHLAQVKNKQTHTKHKTQNRGKKKQYLWRWANCRGK